MIKRWIDTPLISNIAPEGGLLAKYFPFGKLTFQGLYEENLENIQFAHWIFVIGEVSS